MIVVAPEMNRKNRKDQREREIQQNPPARPHVSAKSNVEIIRTTASCIGHVCVQRIQNAHT